MLFLRASSERHHGSPEYVSSSQAPVTKRRGRSCLPRGSPPSPTVPFATWRDRSRFDLFRRPLPTSFACCRSSILRANDPAPEQPLGRITKSTNPLLDTKRPFVGCLATVRRGQSSVVEAPDRGSQRTGGVLAIHPENAATRPPFVPDHPAALPPPPTSHPPTRAHMVATRPS